jgi:hypothetical protein
MIDVQIRDGRDLITWPKRVLVLTKADFVQALRRGTWWRRCDALTAWRGRQDASLLIPA